MIAHYLDSVIFVTLRMPLDLYRFIDNNMTSAQIAICPCHHGGKLRSFSTNTIINGVVGTTMNFLPSRIFGMCLLAEFSPFMPRHVQAE